MYQAAAEQCSVALKAKGLEPVTFHFKQEKEGPTTAPASSGADHNSRHAADRDIVARIAEAKPALIVAFGEQAALACLKHTHDIPVVHSMIPNLLDSDVVANPKYRKRTTGVTPDLRPIDQLEWLRKIQPGANRIAVLHSPQTSKTATAIQAAGAAAGVKVVLIETSADTFAHAIDTLTEHKHDAALMIPDAQVYNTASIKRLLLWGIRNKKGVWTFSDNFVRAGALGCLNTTPEQVGGQTAKLAMQVLSGKEPSTIDPAYPESVERALNQRTAKLIGLTLSPGLLKGVTLLGDQ
jgi:putative ABC transport system substrate-binding protein